VRGNYQRLEQVIVNLLQNSAQAIEDPNQSITVMTESSAEQHTVTIRVSDTGKGIPAELLSRLTDPFFTTRRGEGGTGLGLSVSSSILEEHGGALEFDSEPGRGTTVTVTLPATETGSRNR